MKDKIITFLEEELKKKEDEFWEVAHGGDPRVWGRQAARDEVIFILEKIKEMYEPTVFEWKQQPVYGRCPDCGEVLTIDHKYPEWVK